MSVSVATILQTCRARLRAIYSEPIAGELISRIQALLASRGIDEHDSVRSGRGFRARDCVLITYGDMVRQAGRAPLAALNDFLADHAADVINTVHLLPFYPYSSDDGFSVIDYRAVDPALGSWDDIAALGDRFRLMFDAVINHISAESDWFARFKAGEAPYTDYFVTVDPSADLSQVFRPRALPLLTPVETNAGRQHVWTTFSADQIDLNYASPELLLEILDLLLFYVDHGARLIRLDAIGFMWKEIGTRSLHLPQTHALIQLMRAVLDCAAPNAALVTETNVPHAENISYFGDGTNEAQMVYNFSLPPLTLHAFYAGDATYLTRWAATLDLPSDRVTFFNFLASHDGIGVTPARGILPDAAIDKLVDGVVARGGHVSEKANADGTRSAYELNITYLDALTVPGEPEALSVRRFLAAQAIMLALRGVPGIYFHSLFGSRNWHDGVAQTGRARTINRQKFDRSALDAALEDAVGERARVLAGYRRLLAVRTAHAAFDPHGHQRVVDLSPAVFAVERAPRTEGPAVLCVHNVTAEPVTLDLSAWGQGTHVDLLSSDTIAVDSVALPAYGVRWLAAAEP